MFTEIHQARRGHLIVPPHDDTPGLYGTEAVPLADKVIRHHYFVGGCDWWGVELDRHQDLIWGFANLTDPDCAEWGYSSLVELESLLIPAGPFLVVVERDLYWQPTRAADITDLAKCSFSGVR